MLRRCFNPHWLAALFSSGFFLPGYGFTYVFWLQPEVFSMACVTATLYFGLYFSRDVVERGDAGFDDDDDGESDVPTESNRWQRLVQFVMSHTTAACLSAAALAPAVYNKPTYALVGVPVLVGYALDGTS